MQSRKAIDSGTSGSAFQARQHLRLPLAQVPASRSRQNKKAREISLAGCFLF
jgi:hypothetical protein